MTEITISIYTVYDHPWKILFQLIQFWNTEIIQKWSISITKMAVFDT